MKQQRMVLLGALVLVGGILVWQGTAVAPEIDSGVREMATTTVSEADQSGNVPPVTDADVIPSPNELPDGAMTMCTMDAKQCPDGSYVGRSGPDCRFAACPDDPAATPQVVTCTPEMSAAEVCPAIYAPVCGLVEIQCITTPCNPILETFSNGCSACASGNVISYSEGACVGE